LFPPGTPKVKMTWILKVNKDKQIGIYLYCQTPLADVPLQLYANRAVTFHIDRVYGDKVRKSEKLRNFTRDMEGSGWGWKRLFDLFDLSQYTDPRGAFNLKVEADFFVESDGITEILPKVEEKCSEASELESFKMRQEIVLKQVAGLLVDEVTSDVVISIVDKENVQIGTFFCHSGVLSGKLMGRLH